MHVKLKGKPELKEITKVPSTSFSSSDTIWAHTVLWINEIKPLNTIGGNREQIAKELRSLFKVRFLAEYGAIPMRGLNWRTGKMMDVRASTGDIKWSSWQPTRNAIATCSDIARVIEAGVIDQVVIDAQSVSPKPVAMYIAELGEASKRIDKDLMNRLLSLSVSDRKFLGKLLAKSM